MSRLTRSCLPILPSRSFLPLVVVCIVSSVCWSIGNTCLSTVIRMAPSFLQSCMSCYSSRSAIAPAACLSCAFRVVGRHLPVRCKLVVPFIPVHRSFLAGRRLNRSSTLSKLCSFYMKSSGAFRGNVVAPTARVFTFVVPPPNLDRHLFVYRADRTCHPWVSGWNFLVGAIASS